MEETLRDHGTDHGSERKFNPHEARLPNGKWTDGPGGGMHDPLDLAKRIKLGEGETLAGSDAALADGSVMPMAWVDGPSGRTLRLGVGIPEGQKRRWSAADKGQTVVLDEPGRTALEAATREMHNAGVEGKARDKELLARTIKLQGREHELTQNAKPLSDSDAAELDGLRKELSQVETESKALYGGPLAAGVIPAQWGDLAWQADLTDEGVRYTIGVRPPNAGPDWRLGWDDGYSNLGEQDLTDLAKKLSGAGSSARSAPLDDLTARALAALAGDSRAFNAQLHPRAPVGSKNGGQFAKGSQPAAQKTTPAAKTTTKNGKAHVVIPKGAMGYDPASNHGTGYGMKNGDPRVHSIQQLLNHLGFTDMHGRQLDDDGKLGPLTTSAIKKAQKALGVKADGIVTPSLLQQMAAMKPLPESERKKAKPAPGKSKQSAVSKARKEADDAAAKAALKGATNLGHNTGTRRPVNDSGRSASVGLCTRAFDFEFDGPDGDGYTLEGYAAVFGSAARIRDLQGDFDEVIHPGAFKRSLERRTPVLQFDHGKDPRIGGTPIGKFTDIAEDSRGLHVRARLFKHSDVERVREAIAEKAITGMSFRFGVPKGGDKWSRRSNDVDLRDIFDTDTHEAGPVVFPAYDATTVSVRSILAGLSADEMRELVHELREAFGLAVDLSDLTGRPGARSAGGGDSGTTPSSGAAMPTLPSLPDLRTTERALHALGVLDGHRARH